MNTSSLRPRRKPGQCAGTLLTRWQLFQTMINISQWHDHSPLFYKLSFLLQRRYVCDYSIIVIIAASFYNKQLETRTNMMCKFVICIYRDFFVVVTIRISETHVEHWMAHNTHDTYNVTRSLLSPLLGAFEFPVGSLRREQWAPVRRAPPETFHPRQLYIGAY